MNDKPNYYAIIPSNIRYDKDLSPNAKLLYGEITALCNSSGYCWANNEYFANLYSVSKTSISKWISQLQRKKYIGVRLIYKENSKEIINRHLTIVNEPIEEKLNTPLTKVKYPIEEKLNRGIEEKLKDNNTSINNTIEYYNSNIIAEAKKTKKETFDFKGNFLNRGVEESVLNDWLFVRDKKNGINSKTAFNGFLREVKKAKISFNEAVTVCAERSWITFTAEYYFNLTRSNNGKQQNTNSAKESVAELGRLADEILANAGQNNSTNNIF